jgi:hypothetical protein
MNDASEIERCFDELRPSNRLQLIALPRTVEQRWSLFDRYVELVWIEPLGVTAVAVARRLALSTTMTPPPHATSLAALATPLGVPPAKVLRSLRRLHHHGLIVWREHVGVIGVSGFTRGLHAAAVAALSPYGARLHQALTAEAPPLSSSSPSTAVASAAGVEVER